MIKFGTSGWRAVMGEEFTFGNVRIVVQAVANYLKQRFPGRTIPVLVNYDTRFLSERFANEAAKILSHNQIHVLLADRDAPAQAQALQIIKRKAQAGINFTASFNPPEYNGLKLNLEAAAPALPCETDKIEEEARRLSRAPTFNPYYPRLEFVQKIDLQTDYLDFIQKKIDFGSIRKSKLRIGVDLLYGTSREYLDEILEDNDIPVEEIHGYVDPYFGGITPSCSEQNLRELGRLIREKKCDLGIATDADGDRFGILDQNGTFILQNKIIVGGEESSCIAVKSHLPEKDGIFAGLLVAEMMAVMGLSLTELRQHFFREYGKKYSGQRSVPLHPKTDRALKDLINSPPEHLGGKRVLAVERVDGIKFDFDDDDWLLLRLSGTEPLIRCSP